MTDEPPHSDPASAGPTDQTRPADDTDTPQQQRPWDQLILDVMLGKLARYLRMCGYDTAYAPDRDVEDDNRILAISRSEGRTLLTRDRGLANRTSDSILLTEREIEGQLAELEMEGFVLELDDEPTRCGDCNGRLEQVAENTPVPDYAPDPAETAVWACNDCEQHFWNGSHWTDVAETLDQL